LLVVNVGRWLPVMFCKKATSCFFAVLLAAHGTLMHDVKSTMRMPEHYSEFSMATAHQREAKFALSVSHDCSHFCLSPQYPSW
jgi:hypothetical protein